MVPKKKRADAKKGTKPLKLTEAQCRLVEENLGLVGYTLTRYRIFGLDGDDAFQVGTLGLIRAATKYDPTRGAFSTFAVRCILNELRRELRKQMTPFSRFGVVLVPLEDMLSGDDASTIQDICDERQISVEEQVVFSDMVERIIHYVRESDVQCVRIAADYLLSDMTQVEIAKRHNMTQSQVSAYVRRLIRYLRKYADMHGDEVVRKGAAL